MTGVTGSGKMGDTTVNWTNSSAKVKALHVVLSPDDGGWFAQGLEIDYTACGATQDEAKSNFAEGLGLTVCEHLVMFGNIKKLLVPASSAAWDEFLNTPPTKLNVESLTLEAFLLGNIKADEQARLVKAKDVLPFTTVELIQGEAVPA